MNILTKRIQISKACMKHLIFKSENFANSSHVHNPSFQMTKELNSMNHIGQPSPQTHPHLLKPDELVPGLTLKEFVSRRERLVQKLLSVKPKDYHLILIPSANVQYMTEKIPYVFRQNTDFRYLTGCLEPNSALIIFVKPEGSYSTTIFVREKNAHSELWEGPRTGVDMAAELFGVDVAKPIESLENELKCITENNKTYMVWYDFLNPIQSFVHKSVVSFLSNAGPKELEPISNVIHQLRLIKSEAEQQLMIKSASIASEAINSTIKLSKPGLTEHQLFASVDYLCRMRGAEHLAYPPVVATGNNANIIHYINNTQKIADGELILMDAGCELHGYCSDITRTWPANGKFSSFQQILYEIVLQVQTELITKCSEGITLDYLFHCMGALLGKLLKEAHILSKQADCLKLDEVAYKFCPHHLGHYLGMDVHDTASIKRQIPLTEGMVITIEPGIYIDLNNELAKPEFRGNGIRIEDDVLFTKNGVKVISTSPKTIEDIEKLCQR